RTPVARKFLLFPRVNVTPTVAALSHLLFFSSFTDSTSAARIVPLRTRVARRAAHWTRYMRKDGFIVRFFRFTSVQCRRSRALAFHKGSRIPCIWKKDIRKIAERLSYLLRSKIGLG